MKKKMLCAALLGALGIAQAAVAQEFDDRWYVTFGPHLLNSDDDRNVRNTFGGQLGFGRHFSPNWSFDIELFHTQPHPVETLHLNWNLYGIGAYGRYHFASPDRNWAPFLSFGAGGIRHEQEFSDPLGGRPVKREGTDLMLSVGVGLQGDLSPRWGIRTEAAYRMDMDDGPGYAGLRPGQQTGSFRDMVYSLSFIYKFGAYREAVVIEERVEAPLPPATIPCEQLDDDNDGVNNCIDRCPNSQPGQAVGPDGCPVPLTIDLRGVNFDFDKSTLRPDAVEILREAVDILRRYPELRVEVAGHTDAIGTDAYNQRLSERRARAVYDFLTSNGIGANRLVGPNGYGESRPIAPNTNPDGSDNPEGRARNRRTELNVQN
jgi:OmpA-OmpF porin, OOP family